MEVLKDSVAGVLVYILVRFNDEMADSILTREVVLLSSVQTEG